MCLQTFLEFPIISQKYRMRRLSHVLVLHVIFKVNKLSYFRLFLRAVGRSKNLRGLWMAGESNSRKFFNWTGFASISAKIWGERDGGRLLPRLRWPYFRLLLKPSSEETEIRKINKWFKQKRLNKPYLMARRIHSTIKQNSRYLFSSSHFLLALLLGKYLNSSKRVSK